MLVQAFDFWHLFQAEGCELQMGGSDQWGNITAGIELVARREGKQAHGLVFPLLTTASGTKFGKSEAGNVWLDPARTSPYQFYQFWLNIDDRDAERCLKLFTFLPLVEIAALMAAQAAEPGRRPAQRRLAEDVTARVHGEATMRRVVAASQVLFGGTDIRGADPGVFEVLGREIPYARVPAETLRAGASAVDLLVAAGLAASKGEARRGLQGRGFSLNGVTIAEDLKAGSEDLLGGRWLLLQKGKKHFALIEVEG
jgi:tyrosyl-tRNA synthetase